SGESRPVLHVPPPAGPCRFGGPMPRSAPKSAIDETAAQRAIADLIRALGLDAAHEPELAETPVRVAEMYREMLSGLDPESDPDLATFPHQGQGDLVVVRDLPFHSLCVHHFVPFFGRALVAYLPGDTLVGISG